MSGSIWILTSEFNEYDQHGEYFVKAWPRKPTLEELTEAGDWGSDMSYAAHVQSGGGQLDAEDEWWFLREYKVGASGSFEEVK